MKQTLFGIYQGSARFSRAMAGLVVLLFAGLQVTNFEISIKAQVVLAVIALAIGIPHGAIDHLITIPRTSRSRFIAFVTIYTLIAIIAALADRSACLMAHHGMVVFGRDCDHALALAVELETLCEQYWRVLQLGAPRLLPADEMTRVQAKFASYGQQE